MNDSMREILDLLHEVNEDQGTVEVQDSFDIEIGEDLIIESGVVDIHEDRILIEGDDKALELLAQYGAILEETDWSKYDEPTVSRIAKGISQPVDRTDYSKPPALRDPDLGKPGYEKRRSNIMRGLKSIKKVDENIDENPVYNSIVRRILLNHLDLFTKYDVKAVQDAIKDVAMSAGKVEEIGTSDVSSWVSDVKRTLASSISESDSKQSKLDLIKKIRHYFAKQLEDPAFQQAFIKSSDRMDVDKVLGPDVPASSKPQKNYQLSFDFSPKSSKMMSEKMIMGLPGDQGSKVMGEVSDIENMSYLEKAEMNLDQLKNKYKELQSQYDKLGPHTWMYADFEQNLSDQERKARDLHTQLGNLHRQIQAAEANYAKFNDTSELPDNIKQVIKFIADKVKRDPQNWDSEKNTFTAVGLRNLEDALGFKKNRIEYAKSLYEEDLEEGKLPAAALMSLLSLAGINTQALAYTDPTKSVEELARENPKVKELLVRINALGQKPASDVAAEKWRKAQDQAKPATAGPDEKIPVPPQDKMNEAKYQGREVPLGKPMAGDVKKSKVYVRKPNGKVVKVNFGDKKMRIKKSNPKRRKSFRARHNCKNPGPRWKARYWSCRAW